MLHRGTSLLLRPAMHRLGIQSSKDVRPIPQCFVRYRKPPWAPLAATKLFIVKQRHKQDPEEYEELKTLFRHYRTTMKALVAYLKEEVDAKEAAHSIQSHLDEEKWKWCLAENDKFSAVSAKIREEREAKEQREREEKEFQLLTQLEKNDQQRRQIAKEQVLKAKDESAQFVTEDNLELTIEQTLNKRSLYNFAIDLDGNHYVEQLDGSTVVTSGEDNTQANDNEEELELHT